MDNPLGEIELQILQILGIVIGSGVLWLLKQGLAALNIHLTAVRQAALSSAVDKMMTLGVTEADNVIKVQGWDHIESKNAVINFALPALETKFSDTLIAAGIDPNSPAGRATLTDMMTRMWPDIATRLAASPVTPQAPTLPPVVVVTPSVPP